MKATRASIELAGTEQEYVLYLFHDNEVVKEVYFDQKVLTDLFIESGERLFADNTEAVDVIYDLLSNRSAE